MVEPDGGDHKKGEAQEPNEQHFAFVVGRVLQVGPDDLLRVWAGLDPRLSTAAQLSKRLQLPDPFLLLQEAQLALLLLKHDYHIFAFYLVLLQLLPTILRLFYNIPLNLHQLFIETFVRGVTAFPGLQKGRQQRLAFD